MKNYSVPSQVRSANFATLGRTEKPWDMAEHNKRAKAAKDRARADAEAWIAEVKARRKPQTQARYQKV